MPLHNNMIKKAQILLSIVVATSFLTIGCERDADSASSAKNEYFVKNIVDGDTLELLNGKRVRYIGIDTPETMKRKGGTWFFDPEEYGVEAKEYNRRRVSGKRVRLEFDVQKEDKFNRWLAYVYLEDGGMVNLELVEQGYASLYTFYPNVKYFDVLAEAQEEAYTAKRGLWENIKVVDAEVAYLEVGKVRIVRGRISGVYASPNKITLEFQDSRLTGIIYSGNIPLFTKKGIDPYKDYEGKEIEIVGKIRDRNGPQIIVDNPSQVILS